MYTLFHNSGVVAKMKTNNPLGSLYCQKALGTGLYCAPPQTVQSHTALPRKLPLAPKISPGSHRLGGHSLEWYMRPQIKRCRNISSSKIHISHFRNSHFQQKTGWVPLVSLSHLLIEPTNMWKVESFELLSSCIDIFIASDYFEWGFEQTSRAFSNHFALLCRHSLDITNL